MQQKRVVERHFIQVQEKRHCRIGVSPVENGSPEMNLCAWRDQGRAEEDVVMEPIADVRERPSVILLSPHDRH